MTKRNQLTKKQQNNSYKFSFSDYKHEYEKLRKANLEEKERVAKEDLEKINKNTIGTEIPMNSFINEVPSGRDFSDIYLKHPGNESSDDEDGTEDQPVANGDDEKEEQNFNMFVNDHLEKQNAKAQQSKNDAKNLAENDAKKENI